MKEKIVVLKGGDSPEREISLMSGKAVEKALKKRGYDIISLDPSTKNFFKRLLSLRPTFVFIALHGGKGEDGSIQGFLDVLGIPYTGSGPLASALAMNKAFSKKLFISASLPTPEFILLDKRRLNFIPNEGGSYPIVVKPVSSGSTIGISIVKKKKELDNALKLAFSYDEEIILEEYIKGSEVTVSILGNERPQILPTIQILPKEGFYDYKAKYSPGACRHIIPPELPKIWVKRAEETALSAHKLLGCQGFSRTELIINSQGKPYLLDVNTIPGLTEISLFPESAKAFGISFEDLCVKLIELGKERFRKR